MGHKNWSKASLMELVEYIEQDHCELKERLQKVQTLLENAAEQHEDKYGRALISLQEFYPDFKAKMESHFAKEEKILFPYIRQMDDFDKNTGPKPDFQHSSIKNPISRMEYDHDLIENVMFEKLHGITDNYRVSQDGGERVSQDGGEAFKALYDGLKEIESNIREHINIEQKILFPLAIKLELQLIYKRA